MITLTNRPNGTLLWSFWLVLVTAASACAAAVLWVAGAGAWTLVAPAALVGLLVAGRLLPRLVQATYALWRRLGGGIGRRAAAILTRTAFLLIAIVSWAGGDPGVVVEPLSAEGWRGRQPLSGAYDSTSGEAVSVARHGWLGSLTAWARRSGNGWIWALVPVLCLLRLVATERSAASGGTTYTLY